MIGLRTEENNKFLKYWNIIQKKAREQNKTFFLDCGEGNMFEDHEIECEDLSGWLIPDDKLTKFQKIFLSDSAITDEWEDYIVFVAWNMQDGEIFVDFE